MERLGITAKNSRPYHPQTCGKVERLHQTLKRYLERQAPAKTLAELQDQLDSFAHYYNTIRPHRALDEQFHDGAALAPGRSREWTVVPSIGGTTVHNARGARRP
jgi:transposase InsO family protein